MAAVAVLVLAGAFWVLRSHAATGTLSLSPATSTVGLGNNITVAVRENSGTDPVNAVEADLSYPTAQLQFVSIDATTSAFGVEAVSSGGSGSVTLARGGQTAVTGDQLVALVTFKALAPGAAAVTFKSSSALVRSTDQTNVLVTTNPGTYTVADQTPPSVPTAVTSTNRTMNSISLSWTASSDNVAVTGYRIFRNGTQVGTSTTTTFTNSSLTPGTTYSYTVAANDAAGNVSAQSTPLSVATLPDTQAPTVPGTPTSPTQTMSSISLSWAGSTDNVAVTAYKIFRGGSQITSVSGTSFTDTNLTPNTTYSYTVAASDAQGNTSAQSGALSVKTLPDTQAPTVPGNLRATQSKANITLTWTASTDNVGVVGYNVFRGTTKLTATPITGLTYTDSSVAAGDYTYGVTAVDGAGNSSAQATVAAHVFATSDINQDGKVNVFDLSVLLSNWNATGTNASDLNGDGVVNIFDLSALLSAWTG